MAEQVLNTTYRPEFVVEGPTVHEIAVIAMQDSVALDLGIPRQVFGGVVDADGEPRYLVRLCTVDGQPVRTNAGFEATVEHDLRIVATADTVIVLPGDQARVGPFPEDLGAALRDARDRGARIVSICTAAFTLAEYGLLDGRRATTYWQRTAEFRERYPAVRLEPDVLFVDDGILSSAGVAAGLDLCLHLVRTDFGVAVANQAARRMVMAPSRAGGQAQFIERERPQDDGERLSTVLGWASRHLDDDLGVEVLARRAAMSERSFTRHFRARTGTSPAAWIASERLALARELLESTTLYVDEIARLSGLGTGTNLRARFQRRFGQTPTEYRRVWVERVSA